MIFWVHSGGPGLKPLPCLTPWMACLSLVYSLMAFFLISRNIHDIYNICMHSTSQALLWHFPKSFFPFISLHWVHCMWTHSSTKMWTNLMWHTSDAWLYLLAGTHTFVYFMTVTTWTALINHDLTGLFFYVKACDVLFNFKLWGVELEGRGATFCVWTHWWYCVVKNGDLACCHVLVVFVCCCCEKGPFFVCVCVLANFDGCRYVFEPVYV